MDPHPSTLSTTCIVLLAAILSFVLISGIALVRNETLRAQIGSSWFHIVIDTQRHK